MRLIFAILLAATFAALAFRVAAEDFDASYVTLNSKSLQQVSKVYGYVQGQSFSLLQIAEQHPELSDEAKRLELLFKLTYGDPAERAANIIGMMAPSVSARDSLLKDIMVNVSDLTHDYSEQEAREALAEVERRIEGQIQSPVRETILWLKYVESPVEEVRDGYGKKFSSIDHPKAMGVNVTMKLPESWLMLEGDRPHVLQQWINQNGTGSSGISILIKDTDGLTLTDEGIRDLFANPNWSAFLIEGMDLTEARTVTIESRLALRIDQSGLINRLDAAYAMMARVYVIPYGDRLVMLNCMVGANADSNPFDLFDKFDLLLPVCDNVANSIVFPDNY